MIAWVGRSVAWPGLVDLEVDAARLEARATRRRLVVGGGSNRNYGPIGWAVGDPDY